MAEATTCPRAGLLEAGGGRSRPSTSRGVRHDVVEHGEPSSTPVDVDYAAGPDATAGAATGRSPCPQVAVAAGLDEQSRITAGPATTFKARLRRLDGSADHHVYQRYFIAGATARATAPASHRTRVATARFAAGSSDLHCHRERWGVAPGDGRALLDGTVIKTRAHDHDGRPRARPWHRTLGGSHTLTWWLRDTPMDVRSEGRVHGDASARRSRHPCRQRPPPHRGADAATRAHGPAATVASTEPDRARARTRPRRPPRNRQGQGNASQPMAGHSPGRLGRTEGVRSGLQSRARPGAPRDRRPDAANGGRLAGVVFAAGAGIREPPEAPTGCRFRRLRTGPTGPCPPIHV